MANGITTAFWSLTINNYDEADLALIRNGYPDYCREIVHTLEKGESGTPHIQAWVKLQRQQRMSFIRKLFPGGHYRPLTSDEYVQNTKDYCQKQDSTAEGGAVHRFNDPVRTLEPTIKLVYAKMAELIRERYPATLDSWVYDDDKWEEKKIRIFAERQLVVEDYRYARIFVSATYKSIWKDFGRFVCEHFLTHTHTHTQPENNVAEVDIPTTDAHENEDEGEGEGDVYEDGSTCEGEQDDSGSEDEGYDSSGSSSDCSSDA